MQAALEASEIIEIVGILRPQEDAVAVAHSGVIGYTSALTRFAIERTNEHEIVREQKANPDINVFTGRPFDIADHEFFGSLDEIIAYISAQPAQMQQEILDGLTMMQAAGMPEAQVVEFFNRSIADQQPAFASFYGNLNILGSADLLSPVSIRIYPSSFDNKNAIVAFIDDYNARMGEDYEIVFVDFIGMLLDSVTTIINGISYVLIAFVSISLVVSSIMIGIITYVSVLERTKEIGILRSIGAAKRDVSRVFNAEALIIGFFAGTIGVIMTLLLTIPANAIIYNFTDITNAAQLPLTGAFILVIISMTLSLIAGLIPSRIDRKSVV
jgi:putative ABC transport system permease protein